MRQGKVWIFAACLLAGLLAGCGAPQSVASAAPTPESSPAAGTAPAPADSAAPEMSPESTEEESPMKLTVTVNDAPFTATLADTEAARTLAEMAAEQPLTLTLSDYAGFEKVGPLGFDLPADDRQTTTTAGDLVLYQGDQLVIYYGSNAWSYTRLGRRPGQRRRHRHPVPGGISPPRSAPTGRAPCSCMRCGLFCFCCAGRGQNRLARQARGGYNRDRGGACRGGCRRAHRKNNKR